MDAEHGSVSLFFAGKKFFIMLLPQLWILPFGESSSSTSSTSILSLSLWMARSRRTMALVMGGQYPLGNMQALHRGQSELHSPRNSSMQSG
jgi:hypothetical protein